MRSDLSSLLMATSLLFNFLNLSLFFTPFHLATCTVLLTYC